ncbi:hypothetical protein niasHT_016411 [Heterodera trifolii]|uniref:Bicarbonate transporter-like transmembrane domain-containing protein n=1 Tax=Heterodera trifolii TaxID=157864 RepID=A0ABD2LJ01_9BILA
MDSDANANDGANKQHQNVVGTKLRRRASSAEQLAVIGEASSTTECHANAGIDSAAVATATPSVSDLSRPLRIQIPEITDQQRLQQQQHNDSRGHQQPLPPPSRCVRMMPMPSSFQAQKRAAAAAAAGCVKLSASGFGGSASAEAAAPPSSCAECCCCEAADSTAVTGHCCAIGNAATPPIISSVAERFVLQQQGVGGVGVPKKKLPQHRRLRKYASETSFCYSSPGNSIGSGTSSGLGMQFQQQLQQHAGTSAAQPQRMPPHSARALRTVPHWHHQQSSREQLLLDDDTPSPPMIITAGMPLIIPQATHGTDREVRSSSSGRIFHVRGSGASSLVQSPTARVGGGACTVLTRLQQQQQQQQTRRCVGGVTSAAAPTTVGTIAARQDSADEASAASMGSVSTVASGGGGGATQHTPQMQRRAATITSQQHQQQQQRFKMRRPKSTGQIIIQQQQQIVAAQNHNQRKKMSENQQHTVVMQDRGSVGTAGTGQSGGSGSLSLAPAIVSGGAVRGHNHQCNNNNNNSNSVSAYNTVNTAYDPSYTSATVYSDSITCLHAPGVLQSGGGAIGAGGGATSCADGITDQRRGSNYYFLEDDSTHEFDDEDEFDNVTLMYSKHEKIPMKDFGSEIRATMDIDHLLNKAVLLLDLQETSLEEIFAKIIHEMDIQEPEFTSEQVRSVLFTQDAGNQFHILSRTVQSICTTGTVGGTFDYDQTWICALCMLNTVQHRHVAIARLSHPTNLGRTMQDLRFIIIVIAPSRAKGTKTALETTRTFATLFADMDIRQRLVMSNTVDVFRATLLEAAKELAMEQSQWRERKTSNPISAFGLGKFFPFRGMIEDFKRRKRHYVNDYLDGLRGHRTAQKMFSSIIFLYFACLLPAIAFGVLNDDNTGGGINVRKGILAQAIGGIFFALFGGQPMIILLTTVPLAIYIKVIYRISESLGYDFFAMYACVGLWCQFFLILYAATELCSLMKLATRSAEEMFSLFIAIAFTVESIRAIHTSFMNNYEVCEDAQAAAEQAELAHRHQQQQLVQHQLNLSLLQKIINPELHHNLTQVHGSDMGCHRDTSILYLLLMFGTLWLAMFLYNFRKTPYLTRSRREWLADYALPASVLIMSFLGAYSFSEIDKDMFKMRPNVPLFRVPEFWRLSWQAILVCFLLGFFLSFLFYMDQNICSAIVNNGQNKLKKGSAQHLDIFVVALLNMFLSIVGLPWMHGALPHSPLHLRALADVEERVAQGHVHEVIMNVRETRLASLVAHLLILGSAFCLLPFPLQWIPTSVLHGLFLYMAFTSLTGNEMVERLLLLITEQQAYPPTHYIRRVPQRKVHLFTACQLIQLVILCAVGFSPYPFIEMVFPIVCFCFLPIRHILIPRLIDYKYLDALDGRH